MKKRLLWTFISLFFLQLASANVFRKLERKQMSALQGSASVESVQNYLSQQKPKFLKNKYKKKLLEQEKELFQKFHTLYRGGKSEAENFVQKKYDKFLNVAHSDFSISDFEGLRSEARYTKILIEKHKMDSPKWRMFSFLLTFMADRLSFSYDQALKYNKNLSKDSLKKDFHAFLKRFIELEYQTGKKAEIPQDYRVFMK